jgi:hypothetical protein
VGRSETKNARSKRMEKDVEEKNPHNNSTPTFFTPEMVLRMASALSKCVKIFDRPLPHNTCVFIVTNNCCHGNVPRMSLALPPNQLFLSIDSTGRCNTNTVHN